MDNEIMYIKLDDIIPNRFQPREVFDEEALNKLADSIRQHGVIEPILVRPVSNKYEIIAGERRYKASALAGLTKIPALVRQLDDKESSIVAFIENEHRSDVSAIEEARTMDRIIKNNGMTQDELAKELGVNQSTIANKIRLLNLPLEVQESLMHNEISERHARSLLSVKNEEKQIELLNKIKNEKMTVRELDSEIKNMNNNLNNGNNMDYGVNKSEFNYNSYQEQTPIQNEPKSVQEDNNFMKFLSDYDKNYQAEAKEDIKPVQENNDFMKFLNDFDKNYQAEAKEETKPVQENNDFMKFLNDYDKNYQAEAKEEVKPVQENNDFMKFLSDYDKNYQAETKEETKPVQENNDFMNFLSDYDKNYQAESNNQEAHNSEFQDLPQNTINEPINNVMLNDTTPPITSGFTNQYVEDNENYVDITKQEKITNVDEIISKLSNVINEIKEKSIYKVDTEEINYDDIYQITIKIDKRDF